MPDTNEMVGLRVIADWLNMTQRRVNKLVEMGLPKASRGRYPFGECLRWYIRYSQQHGKGRPADASNDEMKRQKQRLLTAQAEKTELEQRLLKQKLVDIDEVRIAFAEAMQIIASNEDAIPGRLAQQLANMSDPGEIRQYLLSELRNGRTTAADRLQNLGSARPRRGRPKTAA